MATKTLSTTVSRTYSILDKDEKFYCYQVINDNGYRKEIHCQNFLAGGISYAKQQGNLTGYNFDQIMNYKNLIETTAPIDIRIILAGVEITDNTRKAEILASCIFIELKNEHKQTYTALTDASIKIVKEEQAARNTITRLFQEKLSLVQGLDLKECKKIQTAMESL